MQGLRPTEISDLTRLKRAFTTRRVRLAEAAGLMPLGYAPRAGDLAVARIVQLGSHKGLQLPSGRRSILYTGERIILAAGTRYAADQFEAVLPEGAGECHLAAAGGVAGRVLAAHSRLKPPTRIDIEGFLARADGTAINVADYAMEVPLKPRRTPVFAVLGTAMNAGKTTTAARLIHGLACAGYSVGGGKVTGTGAMGDVMAYRDAGAAQVYDFTDMGFASTYLVEESAIARIARGLVSQLEADRCDAIVLEIADGVYQRETARLLQNPAARELFDGIVFAAGDSAGAIAGTEWLRTRGFEPLALSGRITMSELSSREAQQVTGLPVLTADELSTPEIAAGLMAPLPISRPALRVA